MQRTLREQLRDAFEARRKADGLTLRALVDLAGLDISEQSLARKLDDAQTLRGPEIEKIAKALGIVVAFDGSASTTEAV